MSDRRPDFLVVGAMKAATTTLYFDLEANPAIWFPVDKEPQDLCSDDVLTAEGRRAYAAKYRGARQDQLCGDASTQYTQMPLQTGVAQRALSVLGPDTRIIYIVRDPVDRIASHYQHCVNMGVESRPFARAIREDNQYLAVSKYAYQFEPWRERFSSRLVLLFDEFVADRPGTVGRVCDFLGVPPHDNFDDGAVHGTASDRRKIPPILDAVVQSGVYRTLVRPRLSPRARSRVRRAVMRDGRGSGREGAVMSADDLDFILTRLGPDIARYGAVFASSVPWTAESLRSAHSDVHRGSARDVG